MAGGMHVRRLGLGPTPELYFAVWAGRSIGGVMVTGLHNPPDQNGFKLGIRRRAGLWRRFTRAGRATRRLQLGVARVAELALTDGALGETAAAHAYVRRLADMGTQAPALYVIWGLW